MLSSARPRNLGWFSAGGMLFGDWGTSRLYVLGLAFLVAGRTSFWLVLMMSGLILAVGWAYTQICRIYPDGGGVYSAARHRSALLAVIGALLLFADYTITASLSAVDAFHYFGLGEHSALVSPGHDAGSEILLHTQEQSAGRELPLWDYHGPGLWAIVAIGVIGVFNLMGPKHTAGFAVAAAAGMVVITLLIAVCAIPQIHLSKVNFGNLHQPPLDIWQGFVAIVLALSGCEAIANLTGVMDKPVYRTASKAIWVVALEVAIFNLILGLAMIAIYPLSRQGHKEDMLAYMAHSYVGAWGEWPVRVIGGLLLLRRTNTAVNGLMSITYVMSRDNELPRMFQKLNSFGAVGRRGGCRRNSRTGAAILSRPGDAGAPLRNWHRRRGRDQLHALCVSPKIAKIPPQAADASTGGGADCNLGDTGNHEDSRADLRDDRSDRRPDDCARSRGPS